MKKWLEFVIEQILSNAVKYTPKGTVSIYMENEDTLIIEDTGIGIRAEDLPRVCELGATPAITGIAINAQPGSDCIFAAEY